MDIEICLDNIKSYFLMNTRQIIQIVCLKRITEQGIQNSLNERVVLNMTEIKKKGTKTKQLYNAIKKYINYWSVKKKQTKKLILLLRHFFSVINKFAENTCVQINSNNKDAINSNLAEQ